MTMPYEDPDWRKRQVEVNAVGWLDYMPGWHQWERQVNGAKLRAFLAHYFILGG
jgi:hypothetical protein